MCDIGGVYRRLITTKNSNKDIKLSVGLFCGAGFYKRQEKNCKEKKKKRRRGRETKRKSHREQIKAIFAKTLNLSALCRHLVDFCKSLVSS